MKIKRKILAIICFIIILIFICGFLTYYIIEKEIRIDVHHPDQINGTIEVYINDKKSFNKYFSEETGNKDSPSYFTTYTKVSGFFIKLRIIETFTNTSFKKTFNIFNGNSFSISFYENEFEIIQYSGDPHYH